MTPGGRVLALEEHDEGAGPALFIGGIFGSAGGVTAFDVARWDGTDWSAVEGTGCAQVSFLAIHSLVSHDDRRGPALFVGGESGGSSNNLARFDGTDWSFPFGPQSTNVDSPVIALESLGADLYAGGSFQRAGGVPSAGTARWACIGVFADGFETGDVSAWTLSMP